MTDAQRKMVAILREARELVLKPENDFAWSSWDGAEEAAAELGELMRKVEAGAVADPVALRVLFAPTGPLQEVSLQSGWADAFLELAGRFDAVCEKMQFDQEETTCRIGS